MASSRPRTLAELLEWNRLQREVTGNFASRFFDDTPTHSLEPSSSAIASHRVQLNSEGPLQSTKEPQPPPSDAPPDFPLTTPMLVAPWDKFQAQGRIEKNVAAWREKAFADGSLVERRDDMIIFFISQRWWWIPDGRPPNTCAPAPRCPE